VKLKLSFKVFSQKYLIFQNRPHTRARTRRIIICWIFNTIGYSKIINYWTPTSALLYIVFILKFTLKHLKSSYIFRSVDRPQGAYAVPCWRCTLKWPVKHSVLLLLVVGDRGKPRMWTAVCRLIVPPAKTLRYFNRWCGSISCVLCTLFLVQGGRVSLMLVVSFAGR
jgi:hypothetical protein